MRRGYFAVWRKIQDHPFYKEPREFSKYEAWLDLLMLAQHTPEPQEVIIKMNILTCHYGESLKSITTWSERWNWSRAKVFRFLKLLKKMKQIDFKSETVTTRIKIINYETYDPKRNANETQMKRERNASETLSNTDNNENNVNNKKIPASSDAAGKDGVDFLTTKKGRKLSGKRWDAFREFWAAFGYKRGMREAGDAWYDLPPITSETFQAILASAKREASARPELIKSGKTPKMAQGWISGRRWEDEPIKTAKDITPENRIFHAGMENRYAD